MEMKKSTMAVLFASALVLGSAWMLHAQAQ
jgi:hypothetical protein